MLIAPTLKDAFAAGWENSRILFFSAPCGFGKTATVNALLSDYAVCRLDPAEAVFAEQEIPAGCEAVMVDDLQILQEETGQQALCALIRKKKNLHFILLSRGHVPGWLMPFQMAGIMQIFESKDLFFDRETSRKMLESRGVSVSPVEMSAIQQIFQGYPLTMELLCRQLKREKHYSQAIYDKCKLELFLYYDEAVYRRFTPKMRMLLTNLAPFEAFHLGLAKMVSGEPDSGELLGQILKDTTMLLFDGNDVYHFWPIFRNFLLWELHQTRTENEIAALYGRAALYYELQDDLKNALDCYQKADDQEKISQLLIKNAEKNPGAGHYWEMQDYYYALPREEILRSPVLICTMSMLTGLCFDYEASEKWYQELKKYMAGLKRSDSEYKDVSGRIAYLDIALPQRGSKGLIEIISSVFHVLSNRQIEIPEFSVTSTLPSIMNGGKDFCEWSKKDDLLYITMRKAVETILGRDGIGLADCAVCESKYEKGEDVSRRMLTLMTRLGEIQMQGTPDIEFALAGLLARVQISQGKANAALESIENLRERFVKNGQSRFLGNIDALLCRIYLYLGDEIKVRSWIKEKAPTNALHLWGMWRYQYLTRAMADIALGEYEEPQLLLARLLSFCSHCGRTMDSIYIYFLTAISAQRSGNPEWKQYMKKALDLCCEYRFVQPAAELGAALLPLLQECGWNGDPDMMQEWNRAVRLQTVLYPHFLSFLPQPVEQLSQTELQVLRLLCQNLSNQEIGEILDIKLATVKTHVSHILQKLGVRKRSEAKEAAVKMNLM